MKQNTKILEIEKQWLTTRAAMDYLGVSRDFLDDLRESAKLSYYKVSGTVFIKKKDLDSLIEKNKVI